MKLPKAEQEAAEWKTAVGRLIGAAEGRDFMMHAQHALNRNTERAFDTSRKDTRWRRRKPSTQTISKPCGGCTIPSYDIVNEYRSFLAAGFSRPKNRPVWGLRRSIMKLTNIEGDFLSRLSLESWTSPPVFDHGLLERMVREKFVTTQATGHGVYYEITDLGRTAVLKQAMPS